MRRDNGWYHDTDEFYPTDDVPLRAQALYARAVDYCSDLGLPISCIRIHVIASRQHRTIDYFFDGARWLLALWARRGLSLDTDPYYHIKRLSSSVCYAYFHSLDDAKVCGVSRRVTRIYPNLYKNGRLDTPRKVRHPISYPALLVSTP